MRLAEPSEESRWGSQLRDFQNAPVEKINFLGLCGKRIDSDLNLRGIRNARCEGINERASPALQTRVCRNSSPFCRRLSGPQLRGERARPVRPPEAFEERLALRQVRFHELRSGEGTTRFSDRCSGNVSEPLVLHLRIVSKFRSLLTYTTCAFEPSAYCFQKPGNELECPGIFSGFSACFSITLERRRLSEGCGELSTRVLCFCSRLQPEQAHIIWKPRES